MPAIKNTPKNQKVVSEIQATRPYHTAESVDIELLGIDTHVVEEIKSTDQVEIRPTDFVEFAIRIPDQHTKQLSSFSFDERSYLKPVYNTTSPRVLLKCGRQVEKSTYLGNRLLALTCIQPSLTSLYVSPTNQQTKTFSNDRIAEPLGISPRLRAWTDPHLQQNVFHKKFINRSQIVLRYAYLNADRVRGIPADLVCIDEIQDIHTDNIPVIEECIAHSSFKFKLYSGTPKSLDNTIEGLWIDESTQNEWVVPCDHCGGGDVRHWNILDEANIGPKYLICDKCHKEIHPTHDAAQWASMNPNPRVPHPMDGYRIPQTMVPWITWDDILNKQLTYSRGKFHNEVLGVSYDSGTRPLTRQDIIDNCTSPYRLGEETGMRLAHQSGTRVFMGVDWGTGEQTYTTVTICGYINQKFTVFYIRRFEGQESEPTVQLLRIKELVARWRVSYIGADYGGGFDRNDDLLRTFGPRRVFKYQYSTVTSAKIKWDSGLARFMLNRTEVMSDVFNAIKRRDVFAFPPWEQFELPYGQDFLNIFSEYSENRRQNEYKKSRGVTDDSYHSLLYAFVVSQITNPRPDVFSPIHA
jgi:hypothetical protein